MRIRVIFTASLIESIKKELILANTLSNLKLYKIANCLLLLNDGKSPEEIAKIVKNSVKTVYNWINEFFLRRISFLHRYHYRGRGGRPPKLSQKERNKLYKMITKGPEKNGYSCGCWNTPMISDLIYKKFKVVYNPRYVATLLKKMGLSYQKAKFVSDHLDEEKREEWTNKTWPGVLKKATAVGAAIIFVDEVSFAQWGSLARTWAPIGEQPEIKTTGKRKGLKMFGAIEFFSGSFQYLECDGRFNGKTYVKFLKKILRKFTCPVILIEDGAPYHRGAVVREFKEAMEMEGRLFAYSLPSYSPDYNPIEKLWKNTKRDATHCKYFPTFEELRASVTKAFKKFMRDAQQVIGVMKKLRENAGIA
jgi:transposase